MEKTGIFALLSQLSRWLHRVCSDLSFPSPLTPFPTPNPQPQPPTQPSFQIVHGIVSLALAFSLKFALARLFSIEDDVGRRLAPPLPSFLS